MAASASTLDEARRWYAEELRVVRHVRDQRVIDAFARVPREAFFGPGPWQILELAAGTYWTTENADPRWLYHNVLIAIDPARRLNNGEPGFWAGLFDRLALAPGERIVQVGAGTGYYSAILAEIVGKDGSVAAYEIDRELAAAAERNLRAWPHVRVRAANGCVPDEDAADAIILFAGATHPLPAWLDRLAEGGRLLVPMTSKQRANTIMRIERKGGAFEAQPLGWVGIFDCDGARDAEAEQRLAAAMTSGAPPARMLLRRDAHDEAPQCWLHGDGYCFQRAGEAPASGVH